MSLTSATLKELLQYDPATGIFAWRISRHNGADRRSSAGYLDGEGYVRITVGRQKYRAHRLAWLYMTGSLPPWQIDHADMDRSNNKWSNLRLATKSLNNANTRVRSVSKSGVKCVQWRAKLAKWQAYITSGGIRKHLGFYTSKEAAAAAYLAAAEREFGPFARAG